MSSELETAGAASVGGLSAGGTADLSGQPCRNCGTPVSDRHCPQCGQLAASFHRPFISLVGESISDSFALDGRIARTLPTLLFKPGRLSRQYSEGKRARYVPPFRLFLLSSLIFYFIVFAVVGNSGLLDTVVNWEADGEQLSPAEREAIIDYFAGSETVRNDPEVQALLNGLREDFGADDPGDTGARAEGAGGDVPGEAVEAAGTDAGSGGENADAGGLNINLGEEDDVLRRILSNPRLFAAAIETWAPRFSLLLVPLTVLALSLIYAWRRRYYVYDHAIHALHLHSWMYLAATLAIVLTPLLGGWSAGLFFLAVPVYTMLSLRGAYGTGYITSFLRMVLLSLFWLICLTVLIVIVLAISASSV